MTRLELTDTGQEAVLKLAGGNPGAITICMQLLQRPEGPELLFRLDTEGLHDHLIWMAYKDVCGQEIDRLANALLNDPASLKNGVELAKDGLL